MAKATISGVIGYQGTGKTYRLAQEGLRAMRAGRPVYANFALAGATLIKPMDLKLNNFDRRAVVLVDEIQAWYFSRDYAGKSADEFLVFMQGRKNSLRLWWTSQRVMAVDAMIREITQDVWVADSVGLPEWMPGNLSEKVLWFTYERMRRDILSDKWESKGRRLVLPSRRVLAAFDTEEKIAAANLKGKGRGLVPRPQVREVPSLDAHEGVAALGAHGE